MAAAVRVPRKSIVAIALTLLLYVGSYVAFRESRKEVWERDGRVYVIFPRGNPALYYLYRPLTYVDGAVTGMRFHIGPHR
jgi:cbb3-type cytochrome oxidase subunit 3